MSLEQGWSIRFYERRQFVSISFGDLMSLEPTGRIRKFAYLKVSISFGDLMSLEPDWVRLSMARNPKFQSPLEI